MTGHDQELKKELDATLQTRKELGPEYETELIESFVEKLDTTVERRVRRQLAERQMAEARGEHPQRNSEFGTFGERFGFATVTLVLAIPLSAIGVVQAHLPGLLVTWAGIVGVNLVQARGHLPWPRRKSGEEWD
ncbi:hypothetical protein [Streptomyces orinoci]|uniref:Integral membrane protein n=1 Tax=Streptomyces orinoci TaxID=67339 RepID=A0ABV3K330_STRON|nr:hypothetical protein [Streptomyces orinoci]